MHGDIVVLLVVADHRAKVARTTVVFTILSPSCAPPNPVSSANMHTTTKTDNANIVLMLIIAVLVAIRINFHFILDWCMFNRWQPRTKRSGAESNALYRQLGIVSS